MTSLLTGTLPVRPFDPTRFFGTICADGQTIRVAALAVQADGKAVCLSLTGFDTSLSAALATFFKSEAIWFDPDDDLKWLESRRLSRLNLHYTQIQTMIAGTREKHALAFPSAAHITDGIVRPPRTRIPHARTQRPDDESPTDPPSDPRFIFGNAGEPTPAFDALLGHLIALRVILIRSPDLRPLMTCWVEQFWVQGLDWGLITPIPALGMTAWQISGDLAAWNTLITDGVRAGWLPTRIDGAIVPFPQAYARAA